jgi:hypothetical protein
VINATLLVVGFASTLILQRSTVEDTTNREEWGTFLRRVVAVDSAKVFLDIPGDSKAPKDVAGPAKLVIEQLGRRYGRQPMWVNGVLGLSQKLPSDPLNQMAQGRILAHLASLSESAVSSLATGQLTTKSMDPALAADILGLAAAFPQTTQQAARDRALQVAISYEIGCEFEDTTMNELVRFNLATPGVKLLELVPQAAPEDERQRPMRSPGVRIDFEKGALLGGVELLNLAGKTFKTRYQADPRLMNSTFFVSGDYTKDEFDLSLKEIVFSSQITEAQSWEERYEQVLDQLAAGKLNGLFKAAIDDERLRSRALNKQPVGASELMLANSHASELLAQRHVSSDAQIRIYPVLVLTVNAGGSPPGVNAFQIQFRPRRLP